MDLQEREILKLLATVAPFSGLPLAEREALSRALRLYRFGPGEIIFSEGEAAQCSWSVASGRVRIAAYFSGSRLMQVELLERGQIFGLYCRLGPKRESYPCTAMAEGKVTALRIPDEAFRRLFETYPSVARKTCSLCAERLGNMQRLVSFGREDARHRVAEILLRLHGSSGPRIPLTRHEIALQAGAALETVFRALASFRRRGWIRTSRGMILLKNISALAAFLNKKPEQKEGKEIVS